MNIKPRSKYVLVEPFEKESNVSKSGLITPESVEQEQKAFGIVLAVGNGVDGLKKGDKVIYGAFAGERISLKETRKEIDYLLIFDEDIIATFV